MGGSGTATTAFDKQAKNNNPASNKDINAKHSSHASTLLGTNLFESLRRFSGYRICHNYD